MDPNPTRRQFIAAHQDLPPSQVVALIGSHRRVVWPPLCPACGALPSTHIDVAKIFGRRSRYGGFSYQACTRHAVNLTPDPDIHSLCVEG
jgi:hypothetical protein